MRYIQVNDVATASGNNPAVSKTTFNLCLLCILWYPVQSCQLRHDVRFFMTTFYSSGESERLPCIYKTIIREKQKRNVMDARPSIKQLTFNVEFCYY